MAFAKFEFLTYAEEIALYCSYEIFAHYVTSFFKFWKPKHFMNKCIKAFGYYLWKFQKQLLVGYIYTFSKFQIKLKLQIYELKLLNIQNQNLFTVIKSETIE